MPMFVTAIARSGILLKAHALVHGKYFDGSGADAEQSGESAGAEHEAEAGGNTLDVVAAPAFEIRETAVEPQTGGKRIWWKAALGLGARLAGNIRRVEKDGSEDDRQSTGWDAGGEEGSEQRAEGGGDFQKHADANVGESFFHIRGGGAGGGRDHGDERGPDGVADVHMKEDGEQGHEDNPSTKAGERSEKSGDEGNDG